MTRKRRIVDVAVIIPDASPVLTLGRIDRLDLLETFNVPIHIVDQVHYEIVKPENDPDGRIAKFLKRMGNQIMIARTATGVGFQALRADDPAYPSRDLGEAAVSEYAVKLSKTSGPSFVPLVLYEDPDVLELPVAKLKNVHLLNTTAWLFALYRANLLPEALELIAKIESTRATPMRPHEREARTKKVRSEWLRRSKMDD